MLSTRMDTDKMRWKPNGSHKSLAPSGLEERRALLKHAYDEGHTQTLDGLVA